MKGLRADVARLALRVVRAGLLASVLQDASPSPVFPPESTASAGGVRIKLGASEACKFAIAASLNGWQRETEPTRQLTAELAAAPALRSRQSLI